MPTREDLIPLIGKTVNVVREHARQRGVIADVGHQRLFIRLMGDVRIGESVERALCDIELSKIKSITYEQTVKIDGPFDGSREPGDNSGG